MEDIKKLEERLAKIKERRADYKKLRNEIEVKEQEERNKANEILNKLDDIKIEFIKEADETDQLYGSVSAREIQNYLSDNDIKVNIDDIQIIKPIKILGKHTFSLNPYDDLSKEINLTVKKSQSN